MTIIVSVPASPSDPLNVHARKLFRQYAQFLVETGSCGSHMPRLAEETASLPEPYTSRGGGLLLALVDGQPAACIAFRTAGEDPSGQSCEIKRLFVLPECRGHGLARRLVAKALAQARARHFTRAILDTDADTMPAALALYLSLGFRPYQPQQENLSFLELPLATP
jgi:GNAT superfamily N-acetyltransferase